MMLWLAAMLFSPCATASEVQSSRPWRFRVFAERLPAVDDIAIRRDGGVYVTQSLADGRGRVLRLRGTTADIVVNELESPRGLLIKKQSLYVTEQVDDGRVLEIDLISRKRRMFENLFNPEHIAKLADGDIVVTENAINGRLMRLLPSGAVEVILSGLNSPQGLSVAVDGTIYVGESGTGRVLAYKGGELNVVVDDLDELGQVEVAPDGALWITEIGNPGRLLRLRDGALETVLTGLKEPRGVAALENGTVLVAEQARERILLVEPKP